VITATQRGKLHLVPWFHQRPSSPRSSWSQTGVGVGVGVGESVGVGVGLGVGVDVGVSVGAGVSVGVSVGAGVFVGVSVGAGVSVGVSVGAGVSVGVSVGAGVSVGVGTGVGVSCETTMVPSFTVKEFMGLPLGSVRVDTSMCRGLAPTLAPARNVMLPSVTSPVRPGADVPANLTVLGRKL
jgi:hypothetical protein